MWRHWTITAFSPFILVPMAFAQELNNQTYDRYVYLVTATDCANPPSSRALTGFRVKGIHGIITALHGVADDCRVTITSVLGNNESGPVKLSKVDVKDDLALLTSPSLAAMQVEGFEIAPGPIAKRGTEVTVVGYPLNTYLKQTPLIFKISDHDTLRKHLNEIIDELQERGSPDPSIAVDFLVGPLHPGHSGAPVLDSRDKVVGVADGTISLRSGYGWAIPFQAVNWKSADQNEALNQLKKRGASLALLAFATDPDEVADRIARKSAVREEEVKRRSDIESQKAAPEEQLRILSSYNSKILDKDIPYGDRCLFLSKMIATSTLSGSALERATQFVKETPSSIEEERNCFSELAKALALWTPDSFAYVVEVYSAATGRISPEPAQPQASQAASLFWTTVFRTTIGTYPELSLSQLSNVEFAAEFFPDLFDLCRFLPKETLDHMAAYPVPSVSALGWMAETDSWTYEWRYDSKQLDLPTSLRLLTLGTLRTDDDMRLAQEILMAAGKSRHPQFVRPFGDWSFRILDSAPSDVILPIGPAFPREYPGSESEQTRLLRASHDYLLSTFDFGYFDDDLIKKTDSYEKIIRSFTSGRDGPSMRSLYIGRTCIEMLLARISILQNEFKDLSKNRERFKNLARQTIEGVPIYVNSGEGIPEYIKRLSGPLERVFTHSPEDLRKAGLEELSQAWTSFLGNNPTHER